MKKIFQLLFQVLLAVIALGSYSQDLAFKNYHEQNGSPSSEVYQVFQDNAGYIWFATDNGVVRFDGETFTSYSQSEGLADPVVFSIFQDAKGRLWFRSFSGATSSYEHGKMTPYPFNVTLKSLVNKVAHSSLVVDNNGDLHLGVVGKGIFTINSRGDLDSTRLQPGTLHFVPVTKNAFAIGALLIKEKPLGNISIGSNKYPIPGPPTPSLFISNRLWNGDLYLSIGNQLLRYNGSSLVPVLLSSGNPIISISVDRENHLWVGYMNGGVTRFADGSFRNGESPPLLQHSSVTSVLQDKEGGFWFSTLDKGVFYIPNPAIRNFFFPAHLRVTSVFPGHENIMVGFNNGEVHCLERKTKTKKWSIKLKEPVLSGLWVEETQQFWVSTPTESMILNDKGKIVRKYGYIFGKRNFVGVKKLIRHNSEIFGVNAYGIYKFDLTGHMLSKKELGFWCRNVQVSDASIYLAGITGLHRADTSLLKISRITAFDNDKISDIIPLPGKRILIATIGRGFKMMQDNDIRSFGKKEGIVFENVYAAEADEALWMGTEKGLFKINLDSLINRGKVSYDMLNKNTGLASSKINFINRENGETWCFSSEGYSVFTDRAIHFANMYPTPFVKQVLINNEPATGHVKKLSHLQNNIQVQFGFLSFNNRDIYVRYKYAQGVNWNYTFDSDIRYYSLAPGNYALRIAYSADRLTWYPVSAPFEITIEPAWWETLYFKLAVLILISLIFFIYFRAKYRGKLLQLELRDKLKAEKERIAKDLHDNIGSRLVSLSLEFDHVARKYEIAAEVASSISNQVTSTVRELGDTIWAIQKEGVTLREFCDKVGNLIWRIRQYEGTIQYDLQTSITNEGHLLMPIQAVNLFRIAQEAIANSQKHSEAQFLNIRIFDTSDRKLCVSMEDNGKGFSEGLNLTSLHNGLRNMHARASEINGKLQISTHPGAGTRIDLSVPLH